MIVSKQCPKCYEFIEIDDSREFMFCRYCGEKIINENFTKPQQPENVNSAPAQEAPPTGNPYQQPQNPGFATAPPKTAPNPGFATAPPKTAPNPGFATAPPKTAPNPGFATAPPIGQPANFTVQNENPNLFINFRTVNIRYVLQTSIDNGMITQYTNGDCIGFSLTPGKHFVKFRLGSRRYMRPIMITDANTKIYIDYVFDGSNRIDIHF
ncbi:MAG: hypothetical protein E7532_05735 [Ruminococcaceae bacterium]|nr:hypothetical protein [Oscillospiraceae bacterium]